MTEQEKQAMLAFLGTVHAQAKQTDQMIVGQSSFVKPVSQSIQNEFAQVLAQPVYSEHNNYQPPAQPVQVSQLESIQQSPNQPIYEEQQLQLSFDSPREQNVVLPSSTEIVNILKDINLNLQRIGDILEEKNKPNARNKNSKKE